MTFRPSIEGLARFPMLLSPYWRPLLALFGGTPGRSFLELGPEKLRVRFGWLFDRSFPLEEIASVEPTKWPLLGGLGWRADFFGRIGLIGSYRNVVEVRLKSKRWVRILLPFPCQRLYISVATPERFIEALRALKEGALP